MDRKIEVLKRSIGKNKEKKIYSIQNFLQKKLGRKDLKINKIEELEEIIDQLEDSDFENMFDIITEKYNDNYPYYIYKYNFRNEKTVKDLKSRIIEQFKDNNSQKCSEKIDICAIECNDNEDTFELIIKYKIYNLKPSIEGKKRESSEKRARGKIIFLKKDGLALFGIGELRHVKDLYKFFINNYIDIISFEPYALTENSFKYDGPIENDKITVFLLELITNKLFEKGKVEINNYSRMGFAKLKNTDGLKSIKVGGNNLLNATEVAEQIRNGFNLKLVEFTMLWGLSNDAFLKVTIAITMQDVLKITIINSENYAYNEEIVKYIFNKIVELQNQGITLGTATSVLTKYFSGIENRLKMQIKIDRNNCIEELKKYSELEGHIELIKQIYSKI